MFASPSASASVLSSAVWVKVGWFSAGIFPAKLPSAGRGGSTQVGLGGHGLVLWHIRAVQRHRELGAPSRLSCAF